MGSEFFQCGSWFKTVFHSPGLQICFQKAKQRFPIGRIAFHSSSWWQSMFMQHEVSKGTNHLIVTLRHSFEAMSEPLFQHTAWKCEVFRHKLQCSFDQPFVHNLLVSIVSIRSIKARISCIINIWNGKLCFASWKQI